MGQSPLCSVSQSPLQRIIMQSLVALLVLAVAAQAQFYGNGIYNTPFNYGYGYNGFNGFNGYNGFAGYNTVGFRAAPVATAAPVVAAAPVNYYAGAYAPAYGYSASQYRSQDEFGQATSNYQDAYGNQVGSYAYINPEGKEIRVSYVADSQGFRVLSNALPEGPSAMPEPVQDTPEVAAAKAEHMAAHAAAEAGIVAQVPVSTLEPVMDTPEVSAAKAEHAAAHAAALAAAEASGDRKKRSVFGYGAYPYGIARFAAPVVATHVVAAPVVAAPVVPVREATLTKTVLNPNHAVSYRVD